MNSLVFDWFALLNVSLCIRLGFITVLMPLQLLVAQVRWDTLRKHDFGEIKAGKEVGHTFYFTNLGATPLTIETTRTTCGCTAAVYSTDPVQPGAQGSITVTFDGQVPIGKRFRKKIMVYFRERRKGETLRIHGVVQ